MFTIYPVLHRKYTAAGLLLVNFIFFLTVFLFEVVMFLTP